MHCDLKDKSEFKPLNDKISYKYLSFDGNERVQNDHTICLRMTITNEEFDTLHYVPDFIYFVPLDKDSSMLDNALLNHKVGDSISYKMPRALFNNRFDFYHVKQSDSGSIHMNFKIISSLNHEEAEVELLKFLSEREISEQANLIRYLKAQDSSYEKVEHVYRLIANRTDGTPLHYGDEVSIHYKGKFLNGYVFDNTYIKEIVPTFTFGADYQLIEGMHLGLLGLKEGESVKIILPSQRAFGEQGSLAGIVPPYTAVIFEVEIIKVIN